MSFYEVVYLELSDAKYAVFMQCECSFWIDNLIVAIVVFGMKALNSNDPRMTLSKPSGKGVWIHAVFFSAK